MKDYYCRNKRQYISLYIKGLETYDDELNDDLKSALDEAIADVEKGKVMTNKEASEQFKRWG
jgi:hypothetical protein